MGKLKKLRKRMERLDYRVQIKELQQRLAELAQPQKPMGFHTRKEQSDGRQTQ